jgi:hypothetical protein
MATTTSITTTYAGEKLQGFISAALLSANTIENGGVTVKPNVKFKAVIKSLATGTLIADDTCDFTDSSSVTLAERILQPETFQVNLQLCKDDFRSDWDAISMGYSAFDSLPPSFADYLVGHVAAKVAEEMETTIWSGVNANAGEFDGFTTLFAADGDVIDVTGTTVDSSNVIAEMGKVIDAIPSAIYGKEDLKLYVSKNVMKAYVRALGGFGAQGLGAAGSDNKGTQWYDNGALSFDGVSVFLANGLADNKMVAAQSSNLYFGTGVLSDLNQVKVLDMADLDGSQNVRVIARFTGGIQYGFGAEIVYYTA